MALMATGWLGRYNEKKIIQLTLLNGTIFSTLAHSENDLDKEQPNRNNIKLLLKKRYTILQTQQILSSVIDGVWVLFF